MNLSQGNVVHAASFGIGIGILDSFRPMAKVIEGEAKVPKGMSPAIKTGGTAFAASLVSQYFTVPSMLPDAAGSVPYVGKVSVGDGLTFSVFQAVRSKRQRNLKRFIYNLVLGGAVSALTTSLVDPRVGGMSGAGGLTTTDQNSGTTSQPGFAPANQ